MASNCTEIIPRQTITSLVGAHDEAVRLASEGLKLLNQAQTVLETALGDSQADVIDYNFAASLDLKTQYLHHALEGTTKTIKRCCWRYLLRQTGVDAFLSTNRKDKLSRQIEEDGTPDFTLENAMGLLGGLVHDLDGYFNEAIKEVFDWLKPGAWDSYKTNTKSKFEIAQKVIRGGVVEKTYGGTAWTFRGWPGPRNRIIDLDKVFHLLDGKGTPHYPGDLATVMQAVMDKDGDTLETEYFKMRWYVNGNLHLTFLREDLLQKLNAKAGEHLLKMSEAD